jgi:hypothetical protein
MILWSAQGRRWGKKERRFEDPVQKRSVSHLENPDLSHLLKRQLGPLLHIVSWYPCKELAYDMEALTYPT